MRHLRRIALGLIVLFALQAGGAAAVLAEVGSCCPAAVEARPEGSPCRALAPAVCCEERTAPSASDPGRAATHGLPSGEAGSAAPIAVFVAAPTTRLASTEIRALRSTVLRL